MTIDEQILKRVRDMGAIGHTPAQIASLLRIPAADREAFLDEFTRPETKVCEAYANGKAMMDYNTNVELARAAEKGDVDAIAKLDERKQEQKAIELMAELFGI
ncbi:hypothetical protein [Rikenella microfusus]|uniref:hypothetical protein n=1 Tax=Rikenella microfusus TaxID=28139 RepID=UPI00248E3927|nr:hypothetical protein [Rikenella microfusus]